MRFSFLPVFLVISVCCLATDPYPKHDAIDIRHYTFQLEVNDSTDLLRGVATIDIAFNRTTTDFELDLVGKNDKGGMEVRSITEGGSNLKFVHQNDRLKILLPTAAHAGDLRSITISYSGIPRDGLTIGKNKFGDRGFFGDNWPDRGHHWLPVLDHPSDKASVDFIVTAPLHYQVVANGLPVEETNIDNNRKLTHWREEKDIPVKVMVVGIARFAVQYVGTVNDISVQTWVYPQNREEGFADFAVALRVLDFFNSHIGSYNYLKLANVQSKTRWGGLENASTIFYAENLVDGKANHESIIAHEIAHQWFGNSATEKDWYHVWLSEGFATYFSNLYLEYAFGHDRLAQEEAIDRQQVLKYFERNPAPVVDTTRREIGRVLNINTYQKGGWVLHMLRRKIGDQAFWNGIRAYYAQYRNGNALTADFQHVMEKASGTNLTEFFDQWLFRGGHPKLSASWRYDEATNAVKVTVAQLQQGPAFKVALDIGLIGNGLENSVQTVNLSEKTQNFSLPVGFKPQSAVLDPATWLLFEGNIAPDK